MKPLIRVTQIEKFRRWISGDYEYETEEGVINNITGKFIGNPYTWIGTAFHSIVETGKPECEVVASGRKFDIDGNVVLLSVEQCKVAMKYRGEHPDAIHEFRDYMEIGDVTVTGCADMIDGLELRDIKTKYGYVNADDYRNSCQSTYYMQLFGCGVFHYDLFMFEGYDKSLGTDVRTLPLKRLDPITMLYYPTLEDDNKYLLNKFVEWLRFRNLMSYLPTEKL